MLSFLLSIVFFLYPINQYKLFDGYSFKDSKFKSSPSNQTLFIIERNKNANAVYYDANIISGKISYDNPLDVYYIHYATDGNRCELNGIERKLAYGYKVIEKKEKSIIIQLVAYNKRNILLFQDIHNKTYAIINISGKDSYLKKIFVYAKPKLYTSVEYIELYGIDTKSNSPVYEKILNP